MSKFSGLRLPRLKREAEVVMSGVTHQTLSVTNDNHLNETAEFKAMTSAVIYSLDMAFMSKMSCKVYFIRDFIFIYFFNSCIRPVMNDAN